MCKQLKEVARKPRREIERIKNELCLTDEEEIVFDLMMRKKSAQEIADKISSSTRTVFRRLSDIDAKLEEFYFYEMEYEPR